jgi:hypothetical protein
MRSRRTISWRVSERSNCSRMKKESPVLKNGIVVPCKSAGWEIVYPGNKSFPLHRPVRRPVARRECSAWPPSIEKSAPHDQQTPFLQPPHCQDRGGTNTPQNHDSFRSNRFNFITSDMNHHRNFNRFLLEAAAGVPHISRCQGPWNVDLRTPPGPEGSNGSLLRICRGHPGIGIYDL